MHLSLPIHWYPSTIWESFIEKCLQLGLDIVEIAEFGELVVVVLTVVVVVVVGRIVVGDSTYLQTSKIRQNCLPVRLKREG